MREPGGVLLYSHISPIVDSDTSLEIEKPQSREQDKESTNDSSPKAPPGEVAGDKTPSGTSDTPGVGSPSTLHPNPAKENLENISKNHRPDKDRENDVLSNNFHVFAWLNEVKPKTWRTAKPMSPTADKNSDNITGGSIVDTSFTLDEMSLRADLKEMDRFLNRQTSLEDRVTYQECPQHSRRDIYALLRKEEKELTVLTGKDLARNKIYRTKSKSSIGRRQYSDFSCLLASKATR